VRSDPAFKPACGRLPDTGKDLCSQPTISRWENAPTLKEIIRLTYEAQFSADNIAGESRRSAPLDLVPSREEVARPLIDVPIDMLVRARSRPVGEVVRPAEQHAVQLVTYIFPGHHVGGYQPESPIPSSDSPAAGF